MDGAQPETGDRDAESIQQEIKKIEVRTLQFQLQYSQNDSRTTYNRWCVLYE